MTVEFVSLQGRIEEKKFSTYDEESIDCAVGMPTQKVKRGIARI